MLKTQAVIQFQSTLVPAADPTATQTMQQVVEGSLNYAGNAWFIRYEEEAQGRSEPIRVVWKLGPDKAFLLRSGAMNMRQEFVPDAFRTGIYETPYGQFVMNVWTTKYEWRVSEQPPGKVCLKLMYELDISGEQSQVSVQIEAVWRN